MQCIISQLLADSSITNRSTITIASNLALHKHILVQKITDSKLKGDDGSNTTR